jgi:hypothetical protein
MLLSNQWKIQIGMNYRQLTLLFLLFYSLVFANTSSIKQYSVNESAIPRFQKFEITIHDLSATFSNPFDLSDIRITGQFSSPTGRTTEVLGFFDGTFFKLRFSPDEIGAWSFKILLNDNVHFAATAPDEFVCVQSEHHGRIKVSSFNSRYLAFSDSTAFIGIGQNLPWYIERYPQFWNLMTANKCNLFTYWLPAWDHSLLLSNTPGQYDTFSARQVDAIIEKCEQKNIFVIFTIWNHQWLEEKSENSSWEKNPFRYIDPNAKEFFTNQASWEWQENFYQYIISRWGYSRAIAMWQTVSGLENTDAGDKADNWHERITMFFQDNDPFEHPTTSTFSTDKLWKKGFQIVDVPQIQTTRSENNAELIANDVADYYKQISRDVEKPGMIGRFGHAKNDEMQPFHLHNAIWSALANGAAIMPMDWNDGDKWPYMTPEMYSHLKHLATFTEQFEIDKMRLNPMDIDAPSKTSAWGMLGDNQGFGWLLNSSREILSADDKILVQTGNNSKFKIEWYNTWTGKFVQTDFIYTDKNFLEIPLPNFKHDVAFLITKVRKDFEKEEFITLDGWEVIQPNWEISGESLKGQAKNDSASIILSGGNNWSHYTVSSKLKLEPGAVAEYWIRENELSAYVMQVSENAVSIFKQSNNSKELLEETKVSIGSGTWQNLAVEAQDNQIHVYLDESQIVSAIDEEFIKGGIGFAVITGTCFFDDVLIERDTTPPLAPVFTKEISFTRDERIELDGTKTSDADTVMVLYEREILSLATIINDTTWTASIPLTHFGPNRISLFTKDKSGNSSDTLSTYVQKYQGELLYHEQFDEFDKQSWEQVNGEWGFDSLFVHETSWQNKSFLINNRDFGENYCVSFRSFLPENKSIYLPFYWQNEDNHYRLKINVSDQEDDQIRLERVLDGATSILGEESAQIKTTDWPQWFGCFLQIEGEKFTVFINGIQILEAEDNTFSYGKTGFGVQEVGALFDDFAVFKIPVTFVEESTEPELHYQLEQNYPNPFNPSTRIRFSVPEPQDITLYVYNILGKKVATLMDEQVNSGEHEIEWPGIDDNGNTISAGVYFYELKAGDFISMRKMIFAK